MDVSAGDSSADLDATSGDATVRFDATVGPDAVVGADSTVHPDSAVQPDAVVFPDAELIDAGFDCRVQGCGAAMFCDTTTGMCRPGCDEPSDCGMNEACNLATNMCALP